MLFKIFASSLAAAERGMIPDSVCRFGVRRLLRQRLAELDLNDPTAEMERFEQFLDTCSNSPIAVVPEKANEQHYEVPPEFFRTVLGNRLKYSCCEWPGGVDTLDEAECRSLETTCRRAQIEDGQQILELGCGWGSLSLWMAEHFPNATILSVSNSQLQREYIMSRCETLALTNLQVVTADMNDFGTDDKFDPRCFRGDVRTHEKSFRTLKANIRLVARYRKAFCPHFLPPRSLLPFRIS